MKAQVYSIECEDGSQLVFRCDGAGVVIECSRRVGIHDITLKWEQLRLFV